MLRSKETNHYTGQNTDQKIKCNKSSRLFGFIALFSVILIGGTIGLKCGELLSNLYIKDSFSAEAYQNNNQSQHLGTSVFASSTSSDDSNSGYSFFNPAEPLSSRAVVPTSNLPANFRNFFSQVLQLGKPTSNYKRDYNIQFPSPVDFQKIEGVTCFRGSNYRENASYGEADVKLGKLEKVWSLKNGSIDEWSGTGWNGQPAIVKWSPEVRKIMNINSSKKNKEDLKEVIYATLDGNIYFLDLDDGKPTRLPINVGSPHKGSVVVDPRGYPLLYAGQGIPTKNGKTIPIGYRIFNLINQKQLYFINGMDKNAYRHWGAFDSGAMIDSKTDTFIECGENGIVYSGKLNTSFNLSERTISIKPAIVKYRYKSPYGTKIGVENSPAIYKNYIYFPDNSGLFQCLDMNTMKPVWLSNVTDDTDSSTAIEETDSGVFLYTACEVDHQGKGGFSYIRKLNAMTGIQIWEKKIQCSYDAKTNGGALASPIIGKGDIKGLVIYNIAKTGMNGNESTLTALNSINGSPKWTVILKHYCWSSPVAVYTPEGKAYIIVCDSVGNMMLYEGATGKLLDTIQLGANIEASPAVYNNMIVVGTRGCRIWGVKIK